MTFTKYLPGRFQVAREYIVHADILSLVHTGKLCLFICLHVPVTIYMHLEQSFRIDRKPGHAL